MFASSAHLFIGSRGCILRCRRLINSQMIKNNSKSANSSYSSCVKPVSFSFYLAQKLRFTTSACRLQSNEYANPETRLIKKDHLFENAKNRDKSDFLTTIEIFKQHDGKRRGHVEFIYTALKYMEEFGVVRDLDCYKKLLEVFPKEKMVPENFFQMEFMHYPKQQQCGIDVLDQMEYHGVIPDKEVQDILLPIFGSRSYVYRKYCRMMYWMPKFKNASPFPLPETLPSDIKELAKLAIERICIDLQTQISIYEANNLEDSLDKTWIVSGQSPQQQQLIRDHPVLEPIFVEGPFRIWLRRLSLSYFILRANAKPISEEDDDEDDVSSLPSSLFGLNKPNKLVKQPSVHEQSDGVILATCATGTSSRDSLLSWIRFLQETNPKLKKIPVVFTLKAPSSAATTANDPKGFLSAGPMAQEPLTIKSGEPMEEVQR